ncbi:MAG TPA: lytic transglycosylase domain-containing protein [Gammaproteobacteria bacterium]
MNRKLQGIVLILSTLLPAYPRSQPGMTEVPADLRQLLLQAVSSSDSFADRFEAEVWLLDMSTRLMPYVTEDKERLDILKAVHYEATRAHLNPELVLAVIDIESRFDRFAISRVGARGLMQVMPFWLRELNRPDDNLFDITTNLRMGCTILKYYLDKSDGDLRIALARYNGSLGKRKYPDKVFSALSEKWFRR